MKKFESAYKTIDSIIDLFLQDIVDSSFEPFEDFRDEDYNLASQKAIEEFDSEFEDYNNWIFESDYKDLNAWETAKKQFKCEVIKNYNETHNL